MFQVNYKLYHGLPPPGLLQGLSVLNFEAPFGEKEPEVLAESIGKL